MLQKFSVLFFFFLISFQISAQYDVSYYDDFSNNKHSWTVGNNEDFRTVIKSGVYEIEHKRYNASYNFWEEFTIDKDKEFAIETSIKHIAGVEDWGYGIVWGASFWSNSYNFLISANGYYSIGGYKNAQWKNYKKWTKTPYILKGVFNKLSIKYKSGYLYFYINNNKVATLQNLPFLGKQIGFVIHHNQTIQVDYLKVQYNRSRINLVKNINPNYKKKNLGKNINSKYSEIAPIISPDGKTLYVARQKHPQNEGVQKKYDVWYATRKNDGSWTTLKRMGKPINNSGDNLVISVSPDNNTLWLEGLYTS
ncbi:MAG: hypothetical protein L3J74_17595, partial [Bacteroidales bacterium]|nr:hypothetical protein [Bacteroidales bacterium]